MAIHIGFDIGGTFTDLVLYDSERNLRVHHKLLSTPNDASEAAITGLVELLRAANHDADAVATLRHGTTVATNAVIQQTYARTALITTDGFGDVLELARQVRPHLYDLDVPKPNPVVPRHLRFEIAERVAATGEVVTPLDADDVRTVVDRLDGTAVAAVAVCFLHAYTNRAHEQEVSAAVQSRYPDLFVCTSHEVANEFREYERFSTTVLNAAVMPIISRYLERLDEGTARIGIAARPLIMQSSGGLTSITGAAQRPICTFLSGPAAGVIGAVTAAKECGVDDFITFDMGGTSTDVCLVDAGAPTSRREQTVGGLPVKTPTVDIHTVGAGGGSIAWVDPGGMLKGGPQSAGATPGPACYGRGGVEATLTDANLVLGRISDASLLGGSMRLDHEAAARAVAHVGAMLGMSTVEAAAGIVEIATANVVQAIRAVSVARGHDPRQYALLAFGGAGPMHAAEVASELDMASVVIPDHPGLVCAEGLLNAQVTNEFSRTAIAPLVPDAKASLRATFAGLIDEVEAWRDQESLPAERVALRWSADLRYAGQDFELTVGVDGEPGAVEPAQLAEHFHQLYERSYGYAKRDRPIEFVTARLVAVAAGSTTVPSVPDTTTFDRKLDDRPVWFRGTGFVSCSVLWRPALGAGELVAGPAIIEQMDSTTVVPPGTTVSVHAIGALLLNVAAQKD